MENFEFTRDLILVLFTAFAGGLVAKKLRQPLLTGYILGGIIVGGIASRFINFNQNLGTLAQVGIAFLMFTLGLEFSWSKFKKFNRGLILAAVAQIVTTIILGIAILPRFGFDFYSAIFLGCCFSLSSTAVVVKIFSDRGELDTLVGEFTVGWLLIQDLAVLPMMIILPSLSTHLEGSIGILPSLIIFSQAIVKAVILLVLIFIFGKKLIPLITEKILQSRSRELLLLWVVSLCLILSFGAASLGLSFAFGAFLAGFLVAELGISTSVFAEIRPLRDIFAVIFFVTLGFLLKPDFLFANSLIIVSLVVLIIVVKFLLVSILTLYLGYHSKTAFLTGTSLTSVGEFAFVLSQTELARGIITVQTNLILVSVALLSLVLTPWIMGLAPIIYRNIKNTSHRSPLLAGFFTRFDTKPISEGLFLENHVVICGYGRVGSYIGRALQMAKINFVVVDYNHRIVKSLQDEGIDVIYGDPSEIDVLDFAQVDKAKVVIIAIPDQQTQEMIITQAQTLRPGIKIICRSHHEEDQPRLKALRVDTIVQPEFEAALSIVNKILREFGQSPEEIDGKIKRLKIEHGM